MSAMIAHCVTITSPFAALVQSSREASACGGVHSLHCPHIRPFSSAAYSGEFLASDGCIREVG